MSYHLAEKEKQTWQKRYVYCEKLETREDLVFVYPKDYVMEADTVADKLQLAMSFLKYVTGLNPTERFKSRVVMGYRHPDHEGRRQCQPGWGPNWVNIPWSYLGKEDEPLDACSHELVHPFYHVSPLHTGKRQWGGNEAWGDCFCDFLRGPVKNVMGLDGQAWWWKMINADKRNGLYWYGAVEFIKLAQRKRCGVTELNEFIDWFIGNKEAIRELVGFLFVQFADRPISEEIVPTRDMERKYRAEGKI